MEPIVNKIRDGIHMDNAILEQPEDTYRYARNFVIHQVANGMYKAATLKGTELYFTMPENEKPMAFTSIRNRYFMIVLNDTADYVKFYEVLDSADGVSTLVMLRQIANSYMNLSFDWPIRTIFGFYENDQVQRIYWTDYHNSPRIVNVQTMSEGTDSKFAKYLSFTPVLENIYGQFIFDSINAGGNLLNGNYFIAWQYYTKDGYYSDWSPLSLPVSVTGSNPGSTLDAYQDYEGGAPNLNSSKSIKFRIKNLDTDYSSIRIAAFYSNDYNSSGPGIIFYDGDISSAEMTFFLRGSENIGTLTLDELIEHTMVVEKCKSLAPVKLYNVAACIKERDEIDFMPGHANNLLPVKITTKINELIADTTGYPTTPFTAGSKSLFAVPRCAAINALDIGYAGIWYKAIETSSISPFSGADIVKQQGEYYRDMSGKFTLNSGKMIPVHIINKYDAEGVALKGTIVTTQTAQQASARIDMIIISGTWGSGTVTISGLTKPIVFSNDIHETVQAFVTNWYADYLAIGVKLSSQTGVPGSHVLLAAANVAGTNFIGATSFNPTFGTLSGTIVNTTPFLPKVPQVDTITITGSEGSADIYINGIGPCPIVFIVSIQYSIQVWWYQYHLNFPGITISTSGSPLNKIICTADALDTAFTPATITHNGPGTLTGTVSLVTPQQSGTKQVCKIRFIGLSTGAINVVVGANQRTLQMVSTLPAAIATFVTNHKNAFLSLENVDIAQGGTDTLLISAHTAGVPNPAISLVNVSGYPYNVTIEPNYVPNGILSVREDNVQLSGSGGILRINYASINYDVSWAGTLANTVTAFIGKWFDPFRLINISLFVDPGNNTSMRFRSAIAANDLGIFTASQAPEGDMGGSAATVPYFVGNKRKVTVTLTGTEGAANLSVNALTKKVTYLTSRAATALAFKDASEAEFLTKNITLTNSGDDLILESTINGLDFTTEVTFVHTDVDLISGNSLTTVPNSTPSVRIDRITLAGVKGIADIKVSNLIRTATFLTSLTATAAQFVTDFAASYSNVNITLTSSGADLIFTGNVAGANFNGYSSITNKNQEGTIEELPYEGEYMDFKGPTAAARLRGYPSDEFIRLGVLFFDLKGKPFFVRWLDNTANEGDHGDVYIQPRHSSRIPAPSGPTNNLLSTYDPIAADPDGEVFNQVNSRNVYLNISGLDITDVRNDISGFMIVRAPIVHRNLGYGNISFISANIVDNVQTNDYFLNAGYFQFRADADKVPGVYAFVSPEDLFDFKGFVITKGDKLKNILYLSPELQEFTIGDVAFTGLGKRETTTIVDPPSAFENTYSKFYLPTEDGEATVNGKEQVMHEILYSIKYKVGDGSIGDPAGVVIDPRDVTKLFQDRTRDVEAAQPFSSNPGKMNIVVLDIDETTNGVKGMLNRPANNPVMLLCSVYRENNDPYGGYGDASLANTLYMSTGHYQNINPTVLADVQKNGRYIFNNIEVYGGDTFVSLFDHKRNLFNEDYGSAQPRYGYSVIFPVETRMNLGLREGNHVARNHSYSSTDPQGIRRKVGAMKLEDYNYNDGYSSDNLNALYHPLPFGFINNSKFEARMRYSQPKTPGEKADRFRIFPPLNKIDLPINFGIINNIRENYGNVLYWQEDQIGYIPIDERQLTSNAFGSAVQLGVGEAFKRYDSIVDRLGNSHQFGLIDSPIGYHWYDAKRRMYLSLYKDMKLSQDSIISGLNTFFDGLPDLFDPLDSERLDKPGKDYGICGSFDPKNKIVFTTFFMEGRAPETVGISTLNNKFVGFFDYKSRFYFGMKDKLYSFKNNYSEIHRHNTGPVLTLHGELVEGHMQLVIKDTSNLDKIYDTFEFIGNENFFDKIRYQNSNQDIEEIVDPSSIEEYHYRNKRWYGTVPLIDRLRIMDSHLLVTFKATTAEMVELYQITFNTRKML